MSWAIVVPGNGRVDQGGSYLLTDRCRRCLDAAGELAERRMPRAVVFTGWSPRGGPSEAEQMAELWPGRRDVELVVEPSATITAENMARTLPLLIERDVREATLVCGALHLPRVRYFFGSVYPRYGIRCSYRAVRDLPTPRSLAWEAAAFTLMRRQRRAALAELPRRVTA
jgi:uncharacterized SAM-binding protein YcdF (DUF218 family)